MSWVARELAQALPPFGFTLRCASMATHCNCECRLLSALHRVVVRAAVPWDEREHFGRCGQSCPCCRSHMGEGFGSCPVCDFVSSHRRAISTLAAFLPPHVKEEALVAALCLRRRMAAPACRLRIMSYLNVYASPADMFLLGMASRQLRLALLEG